MKLIGCRNLLFWTKAIFYFVIYEMPKRSVLINFFDTYLMVYLSRYCNSKLKFFLKTAKKISTVICIFIYYWSSLIF